ncbi:peptidylprolyl isomerase [Corynebacterium appendicis]|uniref:peptidylprolyl isomerase n=1 Tax=Corynebacterium appendicis TaxID=163202 RepID=UPI00223C49BE|nr:peptidylprolyl isomerase [Corynebacterium appendicis]MCT1684341.1 peptidylprolyl isomerase [Corynebacterium appendicis]
MSNNAQRGKDALKELDRELKARDRKEKNKPWSIAALALLVIALVGGGIYLAATWGSDEDVVAEDQADEQQDQDQQEEMEPVALKKERSEPLDPTVTCTYTEDGQGEFYKGLPKAEGVSTEGTVDVNLDTSAGPIGLTLDRSVSPCTVNAIEYLVEQEYYNDTVCHRLTTEGLHVLQCGDPSGTGSGGPGFQFADEYPADDPAENENQNVLYERGTIAMANSGENTNGSQFFLNYGDSPLPPAYTYFGTINEEGLATLDKIAEAGIAEPETEEEAMMARPGDGAPKEEVKINSASVA